MIQVPATCWHFFLQVYKFINLCYNFCMMNEKEKLLKILRNSNPLKLKSWLITYIEELVDEDQIAIDNATNIVETNFYIKKPVLIFGNAILDKVGIEVVK